MLLNGPSAGSSDSQSALEMLTDPLEHLIARRGKHNSPMRVVEGRKQREPIVDQRRSIGNDKLTSFGDDRTQPSQRS